MNKTQGRRICDILKEIRKKVADEGNLELNQKECNYKGECSGTCPACEAELKKINDKLNHKKLLSIAGCATMMLPLTACTNNSMNVIQGDIEYEEGVYIADKPELTKEDLPDDFILGKIEPKKDMEKNDVKVIPDIMKKEKVLNSDEYVFTEDEEDEFPKGITTLEDLEVSEKLKNLIKNDFPKNHLRGVISPNAKFH